MSESSHKRWYSNLIWKLLAWWTRCPGKQGRWLSSCGYPHKTGRQLPCEISNRHAGGGTANWIIQFREQSHEIQQYRQLPNKAGLTYWISINRGYSSTVVTSLSMWHIARLQEHTQGFGEISLWCLIQLLNVNIMHNVFIDKQWR